MGPYAVHNEVTATSAADLPPEQRHMLVLVLQLAMARCLAARIGHLPIVLTDRTFAMAHRAAAEVARLLQELADTGQQIIIVTTDPSVSQQFADLDVPTLVVTRHVHGPLPLGFEDAADDPTSVESPTRGRFEFSATRPARLEDEMANRVRDAAQDDSSPSGNRDAMRPVELEWEAEQFRPEQTPPPDATS